ncbi:hypothetical protein [Novosphingobium sp. 9U]|uniref:hypothetical protein n=1 Tax=Novosphingobium sp. 9U TaxID=2653158 RepID=UPI0012F110CD|nr:hypothetical protein [Novosphingobium sp. 9U]VWX52004.1 High-affinity nickel-transporter [Novosphingobium sp. 9U]
MIAWKATFAFGSAMGLALALPAAAQTAATQAANFQAAPGAPGQYQSDFARMRNDDLERGNGGYHGEGKDKGKGHDSHGNGHGYGHGHGHCDDGDRCHASPG